MKCNKLCKDISGLSIHLSKCHKIKLKLAKKEGFKVLIIWESEYKNDSESVLNKCIEFLNEK